MTETQIGQNTWSAGLLSGVNPLTRIFLMFVWVTPLLLSVDWLSLIHI